MPVGVVVATALAALVTGCAFTHNQRAETSSPPSATPPGVSATTAPPSDPPGEAETSSPPPRYRPSWPDQTTRSSQGFLVNTCVPRALRDHAISVTDSDGTHLSALVLGDGPDGVLLSHEQGYSICSFLSLGQELADRGYQVLLPEYRNHGASQKVPDNEHLDRDTAAGLAELRRRGAERIFVGGASCGGTSSIMVGSQIPDLVGLLIMSSPARCGLLDAVPAVRKITAPSLFIVSPGDMNGAVEQQVRELYAASASPTKRLLIDDSGYHGTDMFRESDHGRQLQARVLRFVDGSFPR